MDHVAKAPALFSAFVLVVFGSIAQAQVQPTTEPSPAPAVASGMFARIAEPATAEILKLTDEQRAKLAALLTGRTEALAKAAPGEAAKIAQEYEEKLSALLSEEQRAKLATTPLAAKAAPKLRFNFRFQRWSDVLEWFAQQADLSLVLDAPPPGTLNYSDDREYSVSEAIDLLNGVLLTKGYTLIRRERMLLVINVAEGIPESLVPRVELSDLDKRGRFEFVSVLFHVGNRNVAEIVQEIAPLLGPRGKSLPLPKTRQLLVTDTAGVMRAINAVIESIPQSEIAPAEPEKPQLVVYPLKSADPDSVVKVLEALMPTGRFVRDPKANQVSAYATPSQQAAVKGVLEQMQTAEGPAGQQSRFEVYPIDEGDPKQSLATLQPLVPNARLSLDATSKKLAAWGTPADHEIIKKAVSQLGQGAAADDRQVEVYRLSKADPVSAQSMLQNLVPRARLAVDPPTRSIIALASLADQKTIRATLDQLEPGKRDTSAPELRFYPFQKAPPASLVAVLQTLAPKAQVTLDMTTNRLAVVASPDDHATVKATLEQFTNAASGEEKRQLVLYPVSPSQRKRFQLLLQDLTTEFPTVKALADAEPGELAIWAKPAEHQVIADIIEKLKQQPPAEEAYRLVAYSIKTADPAGVLTVLQSMFPATKLVLDAKSRRLVAWTRPAEQESIQSLIEQMDTETPAESKNQLMVYPVSGADPTATITMLKSLVPDATLTSDTKASTIVAWAHKSDQALIGAAIERMQPHADPKRRPHIVAYPVGASDPTTLYPIISALVPTARVVPNAKNGTIAVWATPEEHETIRAAVEEIAAQRADGSAGKVVVYTLKSTSASNVVQALQTTVPEARLGIGANARKLVVWARPADHETIKAALEELDQEDEDRSGVVLKTHVITTADPANLLATLQSLFGSRREVRLSLDAKNNKIVAMATPTQQEAIGKVISEIERGSSLDVAAQMEIHPLRNADPEVVMQVLNNVVTRQSPHVLLSVDAKSKQLIAIAPPQQQDTIRSTIERLQAARRQFEVFQLEVIEPLTARLAIEKLFGEGSGGGKISGIPTVDADASTQRLYVRATSEQLEQIRDLLVKMGEANLAAAADGSRRGLRVLLFSGDTKAALTEIQRVWPQLSKSPLRVLGPQESLRGFRPKMPDQQEQQDPKPVEPKKPLPPRGQGPQPDKAPDRQAARQPSSRVIEIKTADQEAPDLDDAPEVDKKAKDEAGAKGAPQAPEAPPEPQPILVAPGDDRFTIMSDDPEAIAQFEALLRALSPPSGSGGRDIIVHPLHSASSTAVAELLQKIFRRSGFDSSSSVAVEADQRLNAIVVYAGRNDRAAIERILKMLDSDEVPESLAANRPHLIPVKNTSALRIEQVLKDIYKTQLTSGGVKQQIPVPSGASVEVAAVIQQINTANAGPLMSLGVDEATSSIVIMAPGPLVKEVTDLVAELDENALQDTSRGVKIVKLKSTSALRVKEILDTVIKDAVRRRSSSTGARP